MWTSLRIYIYKIVDFISGLSGLLYRTGWTSVNGILIFAYRCYPQDKDVRPELDDFYNLDKVRSTIGEDEDYWIWTISFE